MAKQSIIIARDVMVSWKGEPLSEGKAETLRKQLKYRIQRIVSEELANYQTAISDIEVEVG